MIQVGDRVPDVELYRMSPSGPEAITSGLVSRKTSGSICASRGIYPHLFGPSLTGIPGKIGRNPLERGRFDCLPVRERCVCYGRVAKRPGH